MNVQDTAESGDGIPQNCPGRLTRAQARAVDRYAVEVLGIPGVVLMENAGINAAGAVVDVLKAEFIVDEGSARVAILCGGGNNGGDGYVVARQLLSWGLSPRVYALKRPSELTGDAGVMGDAWVNCGGQVVPAWEGRDVARLAGEWAGCHVVVDAMLGTGFGADMGPVRGATAAAIAAVNRLTAPGSGTPGNGTPGSGRESGEAGFRGRVVALDVPSGLDADTGEAVGEVLGGNPTAVMADLTVTFVAEKAGFSAAGAAEFLGKVVTADIGLPASAVAAALKADSGPEA